MKKGGADTVIIGRIVGVHGIRGGVKVQATDVNGSNIRSFSCVLVGKDKEQEKWLRITQVGRAGRSLLVQFEGIHDRDQAELLRGCTLKIHSDQCRPLPKNSYYVFDLIGLDVQKQDGHRIGKVQDVLCMTSQNVLVIDANGKEVLVPAVKAFVKKVDLENHMVTVNPIEGMLDGIED